MTHPWSERGGVPGGDGGSPYLERNTWKWTQTNPHSLTVGGFLFSLNINAFPHKPTVDRRGSLWSAGLSSCLYPCSRRPWPWSFCNIVLVQNLYFVDNLVASSHPLSKHVKALFDNRAIPSLWMASLWEISNFSFFPDFWPPLIKAFLYLDLRGTKWPMIVVIWLPVTIYCAAELAGKH